MRLAVLSDIHGNRWALDAVLADVERASVDRLINLGDCFHGPLDPAGTFARIARQDWPTVRGNQDRSLLDGPSDATGAYSLRDIGDEGVAWLAERTRSTHRIDAVLACHGDLEHDDVTLIERVEPTHVRSATDAELVAALAGAGPGVEVVLCGHSHQPNALRLADGRLVVNPGSVGLPAYQAGRPHPHRMEAGTPHARWALLERRTGGWRLDLCATPYDTAEAVAAALANGRADWAEWIATGRAAPPSR